MKAEQASNTAKVIAASSILLDSDPRTASLVPSGAADLCRVFLSGSRADRIFAKSASWPPTRTLLRSLERLTHPGIIQHYHHRKRWIESRVHDAIGEGFERLVILGAGFDTLSYRMSRDIPNFEIIELDHPATQGAKLRALEQNRIAIPANLQFNGLDLCQEPFPYDLCKGSTPTLFVIEGVLMYMSPKIVDQLFESFRKLEAQRVRVLFSFMTEWPNGKIGFRPSSWLIDRWLAWRKEPFDWGLKPGEMEAFLSSLGFVLNELITTPQLAEEYGLGPFRLDGENLVACERKL